MGNVPVGSTPMGSTAAAHAAACPSVRRGAGEVEWGSVFSGVPKAQETRRCGCLRAGSLTRELPQPFALLLRHHRPKTRARGESQAEFHRRYYPSDGSRRNVPLTGKDRPGDTVPCPCCHCAPDCKLLPWAPNRGHMGHHGAAVPVMGGTGGTWSGSASMPVP